MGRRRAVVLLAVPDSDKSRPILFGIADFPGIYGLVLLKIPKELEFYGSRQSSDIADVATEKRIGSQRRLQSHHSFAGNHQFEISLST